MEARAAHVMEAFAWSYLQSANGSFEYRTASERWPASKAAQFNAACRLTKIPPPRPLLSTATQWPVSSCPTTNCKPVSRLRVSRASPILGGMDISTPVVTRSGVWTAARVYSEAT
jgi:hypothetical protein